jgi:hypothetical protein
MNKIRNIFDLAHLWFSTNIWKIFHVSFDDCEIKSWMYFRNDINIKVTSQSSVFNMSPQVLKRYWSVPNKTDILGHSCYYTLTQGDWLKPMDQKKPLTFFSPINHWKTHYQSPVLHVLSFIPFIKVDILKLRKIDTAGRSTLQNRRRPPEPIFF